MYQERITTDGRSRTIWRQSAIKSELKAMFTMVAAIAELERNIIVERIRGGIRASEGAGEAAGKASINRSKPFEDSPTDEGSSKVDSSDC